MADEPKITDAGTDSHHEPIEEATSTPSQLGRIREIEIIQNQLRLERQALLKSRPWYRRPGNWIGIAAIVVSVVVAISTTYESRKLRVETSRITSLVARTPLIERKVTITFDGSPVDTLGRILFTISNIGTTALKKSDFTDGPIEFEILAPKGATGALPLLLDVTERSNANQKHAELIIGSRANPARFSYLPSLLNPGEIVELEAYTASVEQIETKVSGKFVGGEIEQLQLDQQKPQRTPLALIFESINKTMGSKWISAAVMMSVVIVIGFWFVRIYDDFTPITEWYESIILIVLSILILSFVGGIIMSFIVG